MYKLCTCTMWMSEELSLLLNFTSSGQLSTLCVQRVVNMCECQVTIPAWLFYHTEHLMRWGTSLWLLQNNNHIDAQGMSAVQIVILVKIAIQCLWVIQFLRVVENIWRIINTVTSIWLKKYMLTSIYFVFGYYLFLEAHSFRFSGQTASQTKQISLGSIFCCVSWGQYDKSTTWSWYQRRCTIKHVCMCLPVNC